MCMLGDQILDRIFTSQNPTSYTADWQVTAELLVLRETPTTQQRRWSVSLQLLGGLFFASLAQEALLSSTLKLICWLWTLVNVTIHWTAWRRNCHHSCPQMGRIRHREGEWSSKVKQIGIMSRVQDSYLSNSFSFPPFLTLAFLVIEWHCPPSPPKAKSSKAKSCVQTCSFQDAFPQGCRCAEREEGMWGHGDFNVLNSHFITSLFYQPKRSVKRTLVLSWLHLISHKVKRCFSALWFMRLLLISSPLLQIWLRACRWTGSLYLCFVLSLPIPPLQFFSSSMQSVLFPPQKGMKLQPLHPGAGWGKHKNSYIEKIRARRKETERDHMFVY